jgi:hypothetical protein
MGSITAPGRLIREMAPEAARRLWRTASTSLSSSPSDEGRGRFAEDDAPCVPSGLEEEGNRADPGLKPRALFLRPFGPEVPTTLRV